MGDAGQLEHLNADTQLVTLSVGGNDLQFATVLGSCFTMRSCQGKLAPIARLLLDHTEGRLRDLYREVLARAPQARVVVVGYPRFVAAVPSPLCGLLGLDVGEARWLVAEVEQFDAVTRRIVDGLADPRLRYVSTLDAFAGGEACSASSRFVAGIVPRHPVYSFHPTREGQAVLAARVVAALGSA
ncbi:MAG: hypothetical protein QOJ32_356 [Frankiaceae bacterium]|nr:hypothetical protein [Frankiaceae bacterium]